MLAARGTSRAELRAHGQRHLGRAARHERQLRSLVEQLVETNAEEVEVHDLDHGPHPGHGGADAEADDRALGNRRVAHAIAEAFVQTTREAEDVASGRDVDPGDEHTLVAHELRFERGADCVHGSEHRCVGGRSLRLGSFWSCAHDEVGQRGRRGSRQPPRRLDCFVEIVCDGALHCFERVSRRVEPAPWTTSGSRASHSRTSSGER